MVFCSCGCDEVVLLGIRGWDLALRSEILAETSRTQLVHWFCPSDFVTEGREYGEFGLG